jgi:hypothetical protein
MVKYGGYDMSMISPKIPVKVVFRIGENPLKGAVSGRLAAFVKDAYFNAPIYALMPYEIITNEGWNQADMVRCFTEHAGEREENAVEWTTIIRDSSPAEPEQYASLMQSLIDHGYDVEPILATQVDHSTRKMSKRLKKQPSRDDSQTDDDLFGDSSQDTDDDTEIVAEDVVIEFDIVNDDVNSGFLDPEEWA